MNIAYHYEPKNLHFLIDWKQKSEKINNNLPHILPLENEILSQVVPFLIAGHIWCL